jgi:hypothetical protein
MKHLKALFLILTRIESLFLQKYKIQKLFIFSDRKKYKIECSDGIMEIIERLLSKDKSYHLGSKEDFLEILTHPYFQDVDIEAHKKKNANPSFT